MTSTSIKAMVINNPGSQVTCAVVSSNYLFYAIENDYQVHYQIINNNSIKLNIPQVTGNVISLILQPTYLLITTHAQVLIFNIITQEAKQLVFCKEYQIVPVSASLFHSTHTDIIAIYGLNHSFALTLLFGVDPNFSREVQKFQQYKMSHIVNTSLYISNVVETEFSIVCAILFCSQKQQIQGLNIEIKIAQIKNQQSNVVKYQYSTRSSKLNNVAVQFSGDEQTGLCMSNQQNSIFTEWSKPENDNVINLEVNNIVKFWKRIGQNICIVTENCELYMVKSEDFDLERGKQVSRGYQTQLKQLKNIAYEVRNLKGRFLDCLVDAEGEIMLIMTQDQ